MLVIRLSAMGDVAMTVPVLGPFSESFPDVKLYMLSRKEYAPFFTSVGVNFIGIKIEDYEGIKGLCRLFKILKKEQFDLVLDLHDVIRSIVLRTLFGMAGIRVFTIDKGRKEKKAAAKRRNKILRPLRTTVERYADVFRKAGFDTKLTFRSIFADNYEMSDKVENLIQSERIKIGIAPFAAYKEKTYPVERMTEVAKYLSTKGFELFLFGGPGNERIVLQEWESRFPDCVSVSGKLSLEEELQLIGKLDLMISMDSANMHLASLTATPVVSIWGATHPYAGFTGCGQSPENMVQTDLSCRPCSTYGNKACYRKDFACMTSITPGMIAEKVMYVLGNKVNSKNKI